MGKRFDSWHQEEENSNGKPSPKGKVLRFFIPQTVTKRATGRCKHSLRLPPADSTKSKQGREPQPSPWTAGEKFPHNRMEKTGAPSRKDGES